MLLKVGRCPVQRAFKLTLSWVTLESHCCKKLWNRVKMQVCPISTQIFDARTGVKVPHLQALARVWGPWFLYGVGSHHNGPELSSKTKSLVSFYILLPSRVLLLSLLSEFGRKAWEEVGHLVDVVPVVPFISLELGIVRIFKTRFYHGEPETGFQV